MTDTPPKAERPDVARARQHRATLKAAKAVRRGASPTSRRRIRAMVRAIDAYADAHGIRPTPTSDRDVYSRGVRDGVLLALAVASSTEASADEALGALTHAYAAWDRRVEARATQGEAGR